MLHKLQILDAGCGSAYLTFAAARHVEGARVVGVDSNAELIAKCSALASKLGARVEFRASAIADFAPETPPDVVLSLHACDTATDEALARGALWQSRVILAAPCCQHELHHALASDAFAPVLRHGLLRERLADILTDAFRALALRVMGYRVTVCEFVTPEHTSKNLMLRAVRAREPGLPRRSPDSVGTKPGDKQAAAEYLARSSSAATARFRRLAAASGAATATSSAPSTFGFPTRNSDAIGDSDATGGLRPGSIFETFRCVSACATFFAFAIPIPSNRHSLNTSS